MKYILIPILALMSPRTDAQFYGSADAGIAWSAPILNISAGYSVAHFSAETNIRLPLNQRLPAYFGPRIMAGTGRFWALAGYYYEYYSSDYDKRSANCWAGPGFGARYAWPQVYIEYFYVGFAGLPQYGEPGKGVNSVTVGIMIK